jgi:hypothetical protein
MMIMLTQCSEALNLKVTFQKYLPLFKEAQVWSQASPCMVCGRKSGMGLICLWAVSVIPLPLYTHTHWSTCDTILSLQWTTLLNGTTLSPLTPCLEFHIPINICMATLHAHIHQPCSGMEQSDLQITVHTESNIMFRPDRSRDFKCRYGHCTCSVFFFRTSHRPKIKHSKPHVYTVFFFSAVVHRTHPYIGCIQYQIHPVHTCS